MASSGAPAERPGNRPAERPGDHRAERPAQPAGSEPARRGGTGTRRGGTTTRRGGTGAGRGLPTPDRGWTPSRCAPDPTGRWQVNWVARTGSTNDDLGRRAARGDPDRTVLVADEQTAGRGRLGRSWQAPAGAALMFSALLRPTAVPPARWSWVSALVGMAICAGIRHRTGLRPGLKWPNDVLIDGRKVAGILAAATGTALVVGAGINVRQGAGELPRADATSLLLAGAAPDDAGREALLAAVLDALAPLLDGFDAAAGDVEVSGVRAGYLRQCVTIGRAVTIHLPGAPPVTGTAADVTPDGAIVIDDGRSLRSYSAGDVVHLRGGSPVLSDP